MIYFFPWCPTQRDYNRFGYFELHKEAKTIVFVDVSKLLKYEYPVDHKNIYHNNTIIVKSFHDLYKLLFKIKPTHSFSLVGRIEKKNVIRKLIYLYTISLFSKVIEFRGPNIPLSSYENKINKNVILRKIIKFILSKIFGKPDYDYVVGLCAAKISIAKSKILAHALDYDLFLKEKNRNPETTICDGILFIDSDYVFHPDYKYMGVESPCTEAKYYPEVNYFLKNISKLTNLDVKIQLHPRSNQLIAERNYDFSLSKNDTVEAIKYCKIVVAHDSTAISLAVLYMKPIILFQTSEIKVSKIYNELCRNFSDALGLKLFCWDSNVSFTDVFHINEIKYKDFTKKYTKHPSSPVLPSWKILLNSISS